MPLPKKWKIIGGSVSAAVLLGSGIASAELGDAPGRIALDDQRAAADVVVTKAQDASDTVLAAVLAEIDDADESLDSPFDDDSPDDTETPDADESLDSPDDEESVDSPESEDSVDSPDDEESVDSPESEDSVDSPDDEESVDSPESEDSVDSPDDEEDESVDTADDED